VYHCHSPSGTTIFVVHVDNIISASSLLSENQCFKKQLQEHWDISDLGPIKHVLGISITRNSSACSISLLQPQFIDKIVEQFGQSDAHPTAVPMMTGLQLRRPNKTVPPSSQLTTWQQRTPYQSLVGSLIYLANATRPDIAYAVRCLASFMDCYKQDHWNAAIRVLRYLKGTRSLNLTLGGEQHPKLFGYSDSDYANCLDTSRSVGGYCFSLGSGIISWSSRKQRTVTDSSCYAKYIALHDAAHEVIFLRQLLLEIGYAQNKPTTLHCDNDAASQLAKDQVWHSHIKHIRIKFHYIREQVLDSELKVTQIHTKSNRADIFTKALSRTGFEHHCHQVGLHSNGVDTPIQEEQGHSR